ncbi:hypothetical protein [Glycomyces buryatensis]|uniref:Uncharacterized protein n=1 Tax=Glycomyces buryatensis TaxID=2570927 RepID=A0A4S8PYH6_9ACTN|nr:hypothetical protein [Glycomyces buryatensis]THV35721.1 hypothetical protein FAB82_22880 [Glycomyces buryatensis]
MGSRSITKITFTDTTVRLYLHWGSPEYQIPNMAEFIFWAWTLDKPWTADSYRAYLDTVSDGSLPAEPTDGFHGDLEHYYRITIGENGQVTYVYKHLNFDAEDWAVEFQAENRAELYDEAIRQLEAHRRWVADAIEANPKAVHYEQDLAAIDHHLHEARLYAQVEALPGVPASACQSDFHAEHSCERDQCSIWTPELTEIADRPPRRGDHDDGSQD